MLYTIGIFFYMVAVHLAALFNRKARLMVRGQWNTWHILRKQLDKSARYVWFHAASLGEFEQGRPMMERLRREHPEYKIILPFSVPRVTRSGSITRERTSSAICPLTSWVTPMPLSTW